MITKIDIPKFGQFEGYTWAKHPNGYLFKHLNIIYGRNYSGKTTLSRILRCFEKKQIHPNYIENAGFKLYLDDDTSVAENEVSNVLKYNIRVYNKDFVNENLAWLHNNDGDILPFAILGEKNVEVENKINEINDEIGSVEEKRGILYELETITKEYNRRALELHRKNTQLSEKITDKARAIRLESQFYGMPNYMAPALKGEIEKAKQVVALRDDEILQKKSLVSEVNRLELNPVDVPPTTSLPSFISKTKELLKTQISQSKPIEYLLKEAVLQEWVRQGIGLHKGKRETCAFCGSGIEAKLWEKLQAHFSRESEDYRKKVNHFKELLESSKYKLQEFITLKKENFFSDKHEAFDNLMASWAKAQEKYSNSIASLSKQLESRLENIFEEKEYYEVEDNSAEILSILKELNQLIIEHNQTRGDLQNQQNEAKDSLRLSEVKKFITDINYDIEQKQIKELTDEVNALEINRKKVENVLLEKREEKKHLESQAKDESKGAEKVNKHLLSFFGHNQLKLIAFDDGSNIKFEVKRAGKDAKNLSEGECSLIAFCYFIAKMEDELMDELNSRNLIIYIDDPISSLDSNHIFFMYSLIESVLTSQKRYRQLFISTHNLEFLKYTKRLTNYDGPSSVGHFYIESRQKQNEKRSFIVTMPPHLKDYVTEFNYLFKQIYSVYEERQGKEHFFANTYNTLYNLPNNIRKFLECYLFYKYPNSKNPTDNLSKLFNGNIPPLINRIINEYSHLSFLDRGWHPMDLSEAEECCKVIIEKLKEVDAQQFEALCDSIDVKL